MACGNTIGATGFTTYGLWWISYGWYLSPWSSISSAYAANPDELSYSKRCRLTHEFCYMRLG